MKIVSLLPSATEIVYALDLGEHLSAVTFECDHPAEARSKPVVSTTALPTDRALTAGQIDALVDERMDRREPLYVLDKERIASIQPDVILTQDLCRVCAVPSGHVEEALDELGCRADVVSMDPYSLDDVLACIEEVGRATGADDRAGAVVRSLRDRIDAVRSAAAALPRVRTVALEWSDPPFVGGHWIPEMVELAGGTDVLNRPGQRSITVTWQQIADAGPEALVFMPCGYDLPAAQEEGSGLPAKSELLQTPAVRSGRVFATDGSAYFSRPGPRLVDGLEVLAWALHPEAFPEPPPGRIATL